jgi:periplasmic copper chaperone A
MRPISFVAPLVLAALALSGCEQKRTDILIKDAWIRLGATPANPAAGYFTIEGGPVAEKLTLVFSPVVIRTEMHESMAKGGKMSMTPIQSIDVPANGTVEFKPGGKHLMLFNVNPGIVPPRTLTLDFSFASGRRYTVEAKVFRQGDK